MATRPQHSKRDRGREHVGLPPKQGWAGRECPDCGEWYWNLGAHYEACSGVQPGDERTLTEEDRDVAMATVAHPSDPCESPLGFVSSSVSARSNANEHEWTGWYGVSGLCSCGWRRDGGRCVHGNPYVPVFRVTRATEGER